MSHRAMQWKRLMHAAYITSTGNTADQHDLMPRFDLITESMGGAIISHESFVANMKSA